MPCSQALLHSQIFGSRHGMIPTWQRFAPGRYVSAVARTSVRGHSPSPTGAHSDAAVAQRRSIKLRVHLSRWRVRLAETNRIRLQSEQLLYHCECIVPLDDTRDARWISLISITIKHAVLIRGIMKQQHGQGP